MNKFTHCYYIPGSSIVIDLATSEGIPGYGASIEDIQKEYPEAKLIPFEEGLNQIDRVNQEKYIAQPPRQISEENFLEMLYLMPPLDWVNRGDSETFLLCEAQTGAIYPVFARSGKTYYRLYARRGTKHKEIINRLPVPQAIAGKS